MGNLKQIIVEVLKSKIYTWHGQDVIYMNNISAFNEIANEVEQKLNQAEVSNLICNHEPPMKYRNLSNGNKLCEECGEEY